MLPAPVNYPLESVSAHNTALGGWKRGVDSQSLLERPSARDATAEALRERDAEGMAGDPSGTATLSLVEDYPEPLTVEQRNMIRQHVEWCVRRYQRVRKGARIIDRGFNSLQSLLTRLERDRLQIQASLEELTSRVGECSTNGSTGVDKKVVPPSAAEATADGAQQTATSGEPPRGKRQRGGLLRSATFANLHSVLTAAKREQNQEQRVSVAMERERIGKMTQLKMVEEDIAQQKQHLSAIEEKYKMSNGLLTTTRSEVLEALRLYDDLQQMEVMYPSRFFLRASGVQGVDANEAEVPSECYDVFFTPAKYTEEVQDMIREQIEEKLDEYIAFRRRVDPLLDSLAERRRQRQSARAGQLLRLIGVDPDSMKVDASGSATFGGVGMPAAGGAHGEAAAAEGATTVADDNSDVDNNEENYDELDDGEGASVEAEEKRQRDQIQSALAALDDFDELY